MNLQLQNFNNMTSLFIDVMEGNYVDELIQISVSDVDTTSKIIQAGKNEEAVFRVESAPAIVKVLSEF